MPRQLVRVYRYTAVFLPVYGSMVLPKNCLLTVGLQPPPPDGLAEAAVTPSVPATATATAAAVPRRTADEFSRPLNTWRMENSLRWVFPEAGTDDPQGALLTLTYTTRQYLSAECPIFSPGLGHK